MSRLKPIDPKHLTNAQRDVYDRIASGARGGVRGPFLALLHSPDLANVVEQVGVYVRYKCTVPERSRELAILVVSYHWRSDYEWYAHAPLAQKQGFSESILNSLGRGESPEWDHDDDSQIYEFCSELLRDGRVSDQKYARLTSLLGSTGVVDLVGLVGYYTLLALTLNAHAVEVPSDALIPWRAIQ